MEGGGGGLYGAINKQIFKLTALFARDTPETRFSCAFVGQPNRAFRAPPVVLSKYKIKIGNRIGRRNRKLTSLNVCQATELSCLLSIALVEKKAKKENDTSESHDAPDGGTLRVWHAAHASTGLATAQVLAPHLAAERLAGRGTATVALVSALHQFASKQLSWNSCCAFDFRLNSALSLSGILDKVTRLRVLFTRPLAILIGTRALLYIDDPAGMECILNAPECLDKTFMQEGFFARRGLLHARGTY